MPCVAGWECRLWRDADVAHLPQGFTNREAYEAADNYGEKSDILRYEVSSDTTSFFPTAHWFTRLSII